MTNRSDPIEHTGGCYCKRVRYVVAGELPDMIVCHCTQCRKQSGHQYATTTTNRDQVDIQGEENITWFCTSEEARRGFCSYCGSHLFWLSNTGQLAILAASLDQPTGLKLGIHIFTADKGDYYAVTDGLPQYEQYPPAELM